MGYSLLRSGSDGADQLPEPNRWPLVSIFMDMGFGLFGRVAPAPAAALGVAFYMAQLYFSQWWLARYRFGPCKWVWRSPTYGQRQPMRRNTTQAVMV
jgi:uncharacterized protein